MPIYAYRCGACGHAKDVLQKISDPVLTTCPACGTEAFTKQVTAAGFQLKGSGWYVTDFRDGGKKPDTAPAKKAEGTATPAGGDTAAARSDAPAPGAKAAPPSSTTSTTPSTPASAPASAPAAAAPASSPSSSSSGS